MDSQCKTNKVYSGAECRHDICRSDRPSSYRASKASIVN